MMTAVNGNLTGRDLGSGAFEVEVNGEVIEVTSYGLFDSGLELEKYANDIGEHVMGYFDDTPKDEYYLSYNGELYLVKIQ